MANVWPLGSSEINKVLFEKLTEFVADAKHFNNKNSDKNVVLHFLETPGSFEELLPAILDLSNTYDKNVVLLFKALRYILIEISTDPGHKYLSVGISLANEVLAHGFSKILSFLKVHQKPKLTMSAIHLLKSMVGLGPEVASDVFTKFNLSSGLAGHHLLKKRSESKKEDIRSAFLSLISLYITIGDSSITQKLVSAKNFLGDIFPGLVFDSAEVITLVLSTFTENIILNSSIDKISKLKLFNDYTLKTLVKLFTWEGPLISSNKRKHGKNPELRIELASEESKSAVREAVYQCLFALCTSCKYGLVVRDTNFGLSERNFNPLITTVLLDLPKPHFNVQVSEFIASVLKACPDQLKYYLPSLKESFTPRSSDRWLKMILFIKKVICSHDIVTVLKSEQRMAKSKFILIVKVLILPDIISSEDVINCFKNGHPHVCYHLLDYMLCILNQVIKVFDFCHESHSSLCYSSSELKDLSNLLIAGVRKYFGSVNYLQNCWNNILNPVLVKNYTAIEETGFKDLTLNDQLLKFFEVLLAFQHIYPSFCQSVNINVTEMNAQLKKSVEITSEQLEIINLRIINVLVGEVDSAITLWKKDVTKSIFMDVINIYAGDGDLKSLFQIFPVFEKIFLKTGIFSFCTKEIEIWLYGLNYFHPSEHMFIAKTFSNALHIAMQETDKLLEVKNGSSIRQERNPSKKLKGDSLPNLPDVSGKQNFSCMISSVLLCLSQLEDNEKKDFQKFCEPAIEHILHYQNEPEDIFNVIKNYESSLSSRFYSYCQLICLLSKQETVNDINFEKCCRKTERPKPLGEMLQYYFCLRHARREVEFDNKDINHLRNCITIMNEFNYFSKRCIVWQIQLYIRIETLLLEKEAETRHISKYQNILQQLITFELNTILKNKDIVKSSNLSIVKDFLQYPSTLKCFLYSTSHVQDESKKLFHEYAHFVAQMMIKITSTLLPSYLNCIQEHLLPFKEKVVSFCKESEHNVPQERIFFNESDFSPTLQSFATVFSIEDVCSMLESLLTTSNLKNLELKIPAILTLLNLYINHNQFVLLSTPAINGLFAMYGTIQTEKSHFKQIIVQLMIKRPLSAKYIDDEFTLSLMNSSEDLLSLLRICNDEVKKTVRLAILSDVAQLKKRAPEFLCLTSLCLSGNISDDVIETFAKPIYSTFWKTVTNVLVHEVADPPQFLTECNLCETLELLFKKGILSEKKVKKFFSEVFENSCKVPSSWRMNTILHFLTLWRENVPNEFSFHNVFKTTFHWLVTLISNTVEFENFEYNNLLKFFPTILQDLQNISAEELADCNKHWIENYEILLKVALKNEHIGPDLLRIVEEYCENMRDHNELPTRAIYELIIKDSNTLSILFESSEKSSLKEHVVDLLTALVKLDRKVCKRTHIPLFLSAYNATLNTVDQKLLCLIKNYEGNGIDMSKFSPFLLGEFAKRHYFDKDNKHKDIKTTTVPETKDILSFFNKEKILYTVLNFPLEMELQPKVIFHEKPSEQNEIKYDDVYDLRFILPMLSNLLYPGSSVNCDDFIVSKSVALIFAALGSHNRGVRSLGYYCLSQFYYHLKKISHVDNSIWLYVLDSFRNSITSSNERISCIITMFLTKFIEVMQFPGRSTFQIYSKYLTVKATLDVGRVPEFYIMFNNTSNEHRTHRMWMLNLLTEGLRSALDFSICRKQYIFETFLCYFNSSLSTLPEKVKILNFISTAAKIPKVFNLICQCGLLTWLHSVISNRITGNIEVQILSNFIIIMQELWRTFEKDVLKGKTIPSDNTETDFYGTKNTIQRSFPGEFFMVLLSLLKKICYHSDRDGITSFLYTFLAVMKFFKSEQPTSTPGLSRLSFESAALLKKQWRVMEMRAPALKETSLQDKNGNSEKLKMNLLFTEVFLCWEPLWNDTNENLHKEQLELFIVILIPMLQNSLHSQRHSSDVAQWLLDCIKEGEQLPLLQRISTTKESFSLLFHHFENSLCRMQRQASTNVNNFSTESYNRWSKVVKYATKAYEDRESKAISTTLNNGDV